MKIKTVKYLAIAVGITALMTTAAAAAMSLRNDGIKSKPLYGYADAAYVNTDDNSGIFANEYAEIDTSSLNSGGFVLLKYTGGSQKKIKAGIAKTGGTVYTYDLNNRGEYETFSLTDGNGSYEISVFEQTRGNKYIRVFYCVTEFAVENELTPFLCSSKYINYKDSELCAQKVSELTENAQAADEQIQAVYNYIIENIEYDKDLAASAESDYVPDIDRILEQKSGICFDYASLMCAMLREQGIPAQLAVGYADENYHAWVNVYSDESGEFYIADPTLAACAPEPQVNEIKYEVKYIY